MTAPSIPDTWAETTHALAFELYYSAGWQDASDDVSRAGVELVRGRARPGQTTPASKAGLQLANPDARYSPGHPTSALYGLAGRNTPGRLSVTAGATRLVIDGDVGPGATTPDSAALSPSGDFTIIIDARLDSWRVAAATLVHKWVESGDQRSIAVWTNTDGTITTGWSHDGTASAYAASSTAAIPHESGRLALKIDFDADNGAGARVYRWYVATTAAGPWTQLGDDVLGGTPTTIYDSTAPWAVGDTIGNARFSGEVYSVEIYVSGVLQASPDFGAQSRTSPPASFDDDQGNTWTVATRCDNRHYRATGEVTRWGTTWGRRGSSTAVAELEISGVLARLGQGQPQLLSPMRRAIAGIGTALVAYWPLEDPSGSIAGISGLPGRPGMEPYAGATAGWASSSAFAACDPLLVLGSVRLAGVVPAYTPTGETQWRMLVQLPTGLTDGTVFARLGFNTGDLGYIDLRYRSSGNLEAEPYDATGASAGTAAVFATYASDKLLRLSLELTQDGADLDYTFSSYEVGADAGVYITGTWSGITVGKVWKIALNPAIADCTDVVAGHVTLETAITTLFDVSGAVLSGYVGERAAARIARLAGEIGETAATLGGTSIGTPLGAQTSDTLIDLAQAAALADDGMMWEPRTKAALGYRGRASMCTQLPAANFAYIDNMPFQPVEGDAGSRNRVTITRAGGGQATAQLEAGRLSVQPPPDGIGEYPTSQTLPLASDGLAADVAWWWVNVGTADSPSYVIGVDLAHPDIRGDHELVRDLLSVDLGDRITITDPPAWLPPAHADQLVQQAREAITPEHYRIEWTTVPAAPYQVGVWADADSLWSPWGCTLDGDHNDSTTTLDVAIVGHVGWDSAGGFTVVIQGQESSVTSVSGSPPSQTLTVVRGTNGVTKALDDGADVALALPNRWSLP